MAFALHHKLINQVREDFIGLINYHTPDHPMHQSKYYLLKKFIDISIPPKLHYFCQKC